MSGDVETRQSRLDDGQELLSLGLVLLQVLRDSLRGLQPHLVQLVCLDNIFQNVVLLVAEALHIVHAEIDLLVDDATLGLVVLALEAVRLDALEAAERLLLLPILNYFVRMSQDGVPKHQFDAFLLCLFFVGADFIHL